MAPCGCLLWLPAVATNGLLPWLLWLHSISSCHLHNDVGCNRSFSWLYTLLNQTAVCPSSKVIYPLVLLSTSFSPFFIPLPPKYSFYMSVMYFNVTKIFCLSIFFISVWLYYCYTTCRNKNLTHLFGNILQSLKELWTCKVIASFTLNGLSNNTNNWVSFFLVRVNELFYLVREHIPPHCYTSMINDCYF